jgi:hypothetical protein
MKCEVTLAAEPVHVERLGVIVVMLLCKKVATFLAGLWREFPATLIDVGVRARIGCDALFLWEQSMRGAGFPGMRILAIPAPGMAVGSARFHAAFAAKSLSHQRILPCFRGT